MGDFDLILGLGESFGWVIIKFMLSFWGNGFALSLSSFELDITEWLFCWKRLFNSLYGGSSNCPIFYVGDILSSSFNCFIGLTVCLWLWFEDCFVIMIAWGLP